MFSGMREDVRAVFDRDPAARHCLKLSPQALVFMRSGSIGCPIGCGVTVLNGWLD